MSDCPHNENNADYCFICLRDENERLTAENERLRGACISATYVEEYPMFRQGYPTHEVEELLTADVCTSMVRMIATLEDENARLTAELKATVTTEYHDSLMQEWKKLEVVHLERIAELEGAILTIYRGYHSQGFTLLEDTVEKVMKPALAESEK